MCDHIFKNGKKRGQQCSSKPNQKYCSKHEPEFMTMQFENMKNHPDYKQWKENSYLRSKVKGSGIWITRRKALLKRIILIENNVGSARAINEKNKHVHDFTELINEWIVEAERK